MHLCIAMGASEHKTVQVERTHVLNDMNPILAKPQGRLSIGPVCRQSHSIIMMQSSSFASMRHWAMLCLGNQ